MKNINVKNILCHLMLFALILIFITKYNINVLAEVIDSSTPIKSNKFKKTIITPVIDTKIEKGKNLVFCSTLQMAWNKLCKNINHEPLNIIDPPWYVEPLNKLINQPALLSEDAYFSMAGFKKDNIVEKINKGLRKKFKHLSETEFITIKDDLISPYDIMAFSYLYKNLEFETPFYRISPIRAKTDEDVIRIKRFGVEKFDLSNPEHKKLLNQIKLLYYNTKDKNTNQPEGFIIELKTKSETDELILSTLIIEDTLEKTYMKINECIKNKVNTKFTEIIGRITIPVINFDIIHSFDELNEKLIIKPKWAKENYILSKVIQKIKFTLNECGAKLISYSNIITKITCYSQELFLDIHPPFVVMLRSKGAIAPYFIAYIDNEELLETINLELIPLDKCGIEFTNEVNISICQAIINGASVKAIEKMIKSGADINAIDQYGEKAIGYAFEHNNYKLIKLLFENKVDVSTIGVYLLKQNIYQFQCDFLNILIDKKIKFGDFMTRKVASDPDITNVIKQTHNKMHFLLNSKIDNLNTTETLLYLIHGQIFYEELIDELINFGADINLKTKNGDTLLIIAIKRKMSIQFIKKLIKKGADIKEVDIKGRDALFYAKENMMDDVVKLLTVK